MLNYTTGKRKRKSNVKGIAKGFQGTDTAQMSEFYLTSFAWKRIKFI